MAISPDLVLPILRTLPRLGGKAVALNVLHKARLATGWYARTGPIRPWPRFEPALLARRVPLFAAPDDTLLARHVSPETRSQVLADAARVLGGELLHFSHRWLPTPTDWRADPRGGPPTDSVHWSKVKIRGHDAADVRWIWESSRFDVAFLLARAHHLDSGNPAYVQRFIELLTSFREHNPPALGVHWGCGQECALRATALLWADEAFLGAPGWTEPVRLGLYSTVQALVERVDTALEYALSQENTHALSEATALFLFGAAFPSHPLASERRQRGRTHFCGQIRAQFAPDGTYLPTSFNYSRMALRTALRFIQAARAIGEEVPTDVQSRLRSQARFLTDAMATGSGRLPNHGANDGSRLHVLNGCGFEDFRPAVQLAAWLLDGERRLPPGPWDEELVWAGADPAQVPLVPPPAPRTTSYPDGGFHLLRDGEHFGAIRCHTFQMRPSQADVFHLDVWMGDLNLLEDRGSYAYADPDGWWASFKSSGGHNTVIVDERDQMRHAGRFLYVDWARARLRGFPRLWPGWDGDGFDAEHTAYGDGRTGVLHRRRVLLRGGEWAIIDDLVCAPEHRFRSRVCWHPGGVDDWARDDAADGLVTIRSERIQRALTVYAAPGAVHDVEWLQGEEHLPRTGRSFSFGAVTARPVLTVGRPAVGPARWITLLRDGAEPLEASAGALSWQGLRLPLDPGLEPGPL